MYEHPRTSPHTTPSPPGCLTAPVSRVLNQRLGEGDIANPGQGGSCTQGQMGGWLLGTFTYSVPCNFPPLHEPPPVRDPLAVSLPTHPLP